MPRTSETFIEEARRVTSRLRALDRRRVVFGAASHRYRFRPKLSVESVLEFERRARVSLPDAYRAFLIELGNGGCGPYYGIVPLDHHSNAVSEEFPYTDPYEFPEDASDEEMDVPLPGCLRLAEYGCGTELFLVVNGTTAGQVWFDSRYESGLSPAEDASGNRLKFDHWWLRTMGAHLEAFEMIQGLMEHGTPHDEIHNRLEPKILQLHIDEMMLSLMDKDPDGKPSKVPDKPWGVQCGLVEDHYERWQRQRSFTKPTALLRRLLRIKEG